VSDEQSSQVCLKTAVRICGERVRECVLCVMITCVKPVETVGRHPSGKRAIRAVDKSSVEKDIRRQGMGRYGVCWWRGVMEDG